MKEQDILRCIIKSYREAVDENITDLDLQKQNKSRSKRFLSILTDKLQTYFSDKSNTVVFSIEKENKSFKRNEFIFDVHVCECDKTISMVHKRGIPFIVKSVIEIESEFESNLSDTISDFNKLVCGKAEMKIIIFPFAKKPDNYLFPLKIIARNINESLWAILLPHPKYWKKEKAIKYAVYQWTKNAWDKIDID